MAARKIARSAATDRTVALTTLRAVIASLSSSARAIESRTGLTHAQLFLLRQISRHDDASINELAVLARTRQNTVSAVVGRLVRHGMIRNNRSATDGRRASISLTPKGERLLAKAPESPTEVLIAGVDAIGDGDARSLATGLKALAAVILASMRVRPRCSLKIDVVPIDRVPEEGDDAESRYRQCMGASCRHRLNGRMPSCSTAGAERVACRRASAAGRFTRHGAQRVGAQWWAAAIERSRRRGTHQGPPRVTRRDAALRLQPCRAHVRRPGVAGYESEDSSGQSRPPHPDHGELRRARIG